MTIKTQFFFQIFVLLNFSLVFSQNDLKQKESGLNENAYLAKGTKTLTSDGTWCWFQDPRAIYYKGNKEQTYSGWITSDGKIQVASYNHNTGEVIQHTIKENFQVDDHNNPTFLVRKDGRIMVSYSGHFFGPMRVLVSKNPEDISSFGNEATFGSQVTYANPYQIGDDIYMFYRDGSSWHPSIAISKDGGLSWGAPKTLIKRNAAQKRPYARYTQDSKGGVHITFTTGHPRQEASNKIYYVYFKDNKFYKADGTFIKNYSGTSSALDIDAGEPEVVYNASNGKGWTWDIALDENEQPVILYAAFPNDTNHHYYYAKFDGVKWNNNFIVNSGKWFPQTPAGGNEPEPNYSGGMSLDPNDVSTIYLSKQVNGVFEIFKYETPDYGVTWNSTAITANSPSNIVNVRPVVPRNHKPGSFDVLWMRGRYTTYQNYHTAIMYYSPSDEMQYFDFGTNTSPIDTNATRVTDTSIDNGNYGFTNTTNLSSTDETQGSKSKTDYVSGLNTGTFNLKLLNGTYKVTIVQGSNTLSLNGQTIKINNTNVLTDGASEVGQFKTHVFTVKITNGLLEVALTNSNGGNNLWLINSLLIETIDLAVTGFELKEENIFLFQNDTHKLSYTSYPAELEPTDITWSTEDANIATVNSEGVVTAKSPGTTKIIASLMDGTLTDSVTFTVVAINILREDEITLDFGTSTSPLMNGAKRISEFSSFNGTYGWKNNNSILSRDRGSSISPGLDFVLSSTDKEFLVYLQNGMYKVTVVNGDSDYSHDTIFMAVNGEIKLENISNSAGSYATNTFDVNITNNKFLFKIGDGGGNDANWVLNSIKIVKTGSLDVKQEKKKDLKIYPNPVENILNIQNSNDLNEISKIEIYSTLGKKVLTTLSKESTNVSNLTSGMYFVKFYNSDTTLIEIKRFIKK